MVHSEQTYDACRVVRQARIQHAWVATVKRTIWASSRVETILHRYPAQSSYITASCVVSKAIDGQTDMPH